MTGADDARALLRRLRERGIEVEADGKTLRLRGPREAVRKQALQEAARNAKPELLAALRRERVERLLDLVPVDPETGLPALPADEPATERQVERLRELADDPAFGEHRSRVREIVEAALQKDISQLGAYGLIGDLGRRISERRRRDRASEETAPKRCKDCDRPVGPTSAVCASCKHGETEEGVE